MNDILVSGLTIIRNGLRFDYPFLEVIRSALPLCDEYIVVVGASDDGTREAVEAIGDPRIRIVDTVWSPLVTPRKCTLAQQTNIGLHLCRGRWCIALQGNEVLHEQDLPRIRSLMEQHADDPQVEALLLERLTPWADFHHVIATYPFLFKFSPRIVKPHVGMHSIRDAMSFAVFDNWSLRGRYPRAIDTGCFLYRYSHVHTIDTMGEKGEAVHRTGKEPLPEDWFLTSRSSRTICSWDRGHPSVMAERMAGFPRQYDPADPRCRHALTWNERTRLWETNWYHRFGFPRHRNKRYTLLGDYLPKDRPR